jgi:glycosyltransferase involved in cell wall biosynthesis
MLLKSFFGPSIPVLCYHATHEADYYSAQRLGEHLDVVEQLGFKTISAQALFDIVLERRQPSGREIVITFDDGHLSNWLYAVPLLERRSMNGVFFLVSDLIGHGPVRGMEAAADLKPQREGFMDFLERGDNSQFLNEAEARAMLERGHEVYAHSATHAGCFRDMRYRHQWGVHSHWSLAGIYGRPRDERLPEFETGSAYVYDGYWPVFEVDRMRIVKRSTEERRRFCRDDFCRCMTCIRDINGLERQLFCWPWGHYDEVSEAELRAAGFGGAFTLERGFNGPGSNPFRLNRIGVAPGQPSSWLLSRLKVYRSGWKSRVIFKRYRKKPEIKTILYTTNANRLSGGSRQMVNNALGMAEAGLRVVVCAPSDSDLKTALGHSGVEYVGWDGFKNALATARFFRKLIRRRGVDVAHTFHSRAQRAALYGKLWSFLFGPRFKLFINRGVIYKPNPLYFLFVRIADGAIVNSFACRDVLARWFAPKGRLNVVYNSYVGDLCETAGPSQDNIPTALYVGNMASVKGFDVFLQAVQRYGATHPSGKARFKALGIELLHQFEPDFPQGVLDRVESPGHVEHADVVQSLRDADIYVLTSRQESMPNTMLEAFAMGLPAVSTRAGGAAELIRDGVNGFLCDVEDADCAAERMAKLFEDAAARRRMGRVNLELARTQFSNTNKTINLLRVYSGERVADALDVEAAASQAERRSEN